MPPPSIAKIHLKITYIKFHSNFPGAIELIYWTMVYHHMSVFWWHHLFPVSIVHALISSFQYHTSSHEKLLFFCCAIKSIKLFIMQNLNFFHKNCELQMLKIESWYWCYFLSLVAVVVVIVTTSHDDKVDIEATLCFQWIAHYLFSLIYWNTLVTIFQITFSDGICQKSILIKIFHLFMIVSNGLVNGFVSNRALGIVNPMTMFNDPYICSPRPHWVNINTPRFIHERHWVSVTSSKCGLGFTFTIVACDMTLICWVHPKKYPHGLKFVWYGFLPIGCNSLWPSDVMWR